MKVESNVNTEWLRNLYKYIDYHNLQLLCFLLQEVKPGEEIDFSNRIAHMFYLDLSEYTDSEEDIENIEESIFQLIENKKELLIYSDGANENLKEEVKELTEELGLTVHLIDEYSMNAPNELKDFEQEEIHVVQEIFEEEQCLPRKLSPKDIQTEITIKENGIAVLEDDSFLYLEQPIGELFSLLFSKVKHGNEEKYLSSTYFKPHVYSLTRLLATRYQYGGKAEEKIIQWKENIFEKIRNVEPKEYEMLPIELVEVLTTNEYVPIDKVKEIVNERV